MSYGLLKLLINQYQQLDQQHSKLFYTMQFLQMVELKLLIQYKEIFHSCCFVHWQNKLNMQILALKQIEQTGNNCRASLQGRETKELI